MSPTRWPALVLTAGIGMRLRPLSLLRAKPALPLAGVPLAGRILQWLASAGVQSTVLNLHHLPATITAAVGDGSAFGIQVRYSWEKMILGSAGGPARALPLLASNQFLIVNGDTITNVDLAGLQAAHVRSGARVTMALIPNPDPLFYGGVTVAADGAITSFTGPGPANAGLHFIGAQAVNADVFAPLDPNQPAETVTGIYRAMIARDPGSVRAFTSDATFRDIGTVHDYLETSLLVAAAEGTGDRLVERGVAVAADARIHRSILWDDVRVGVGASLDGCVVCDGVVIPAGARFAHQCIRRRDGAEAGAGEVAVGDLLVSPIVPRLRLVSRRT